MSWYGCFYIMQYGCVHAKAAWMHSCHGMVVFISCSMDVFMPCVCGVQCLQITCSYHAVAVYSLIRPSEWYLDGANAYINTAVKYSCDAMLTHCRCVHLCSVSTVSVFN